MVAWWAISSGWTPKPGKPILPKTLSLLLHHVPITCSMADAYSSHTNPLTLILCQSRGRVTLDSSRTYFSSS